MYQNKFVILSGDKILSSSNQWVDIEDVTIGDTLVSYDTGSSSKGTTTIKDMELIQWGGDYLINNTYKFMSGSRVYNSPNDAGNLVSSGIVIGNILGSNIANIALVLGFCAFLYKVIFESNVLKDLLFISFLGSYVLICVYFNISINYVHGILLLISFLFYFYYLILNNRSDEEHIDNKSTNLLYSSFIIIITIIGLSLGTNLIVENALEISKLLGMSELNLGFSIIALGTSLPELFTSLASIKRKKYNLLIGNIIGSNILNVIFVLGIASLFTNINVSSDFINGGNFIGIVFIGSHLILLLSYLINKSVSKISGFLLLVIYFLFIFKLF